VPDLADAEGFPALLVASADSMLEIGVAVLGTFALILSRHGAAVLALLRSGQEYAWWGWLGLHAAGLLAFLALAWPVFGPETEGAAPSGTWLLALALTGLATLLCLLFAAAPPGAWWALARREWLGAVASVVAGTAAFTGGVLANQAWFPLAELTLRATRWVLAPLYPALHYDPDRYLIGANDFMVQIAPVCSGIEGMALMTVFVIAYLWLFRSELQFPAAFLLLPLGVAAIWVANVVRIAVLIAIGASWSPDVAVTGWHSQAGWIGFSIVALLLIALAHRLMHRPASAPVTAAGRGALPYLLPFLALMASSMVVAGLSDGFALLYPLGVVVTGAVLWVYRRDYPPLRWPVAAEPVLIGIAVFVAWLLLETSDAAAGEALQAELAGLPGGIAAAWIAFRVVGCVVTVPIAEELAFRGYLIRKLVAVDFENVPPGRFTWLSFLASSLLFGLLHQSWLAGTVAGAGFALALYRRGRLGDAIVAHMTSNALVAAAVLLGGYWSLWA
jgi:exosortase E/protease (VPEID-CTERM system)